MSITTKSKLRRFLDAVHGPRWARIIPLVVMLGVYIATMVIWKPTAIADWIKPLFLNFMSTGGMYFVSRFSSGSERFKDVGVLFFSTFTLLASLMIPGMQPSAFSGEFNPGLGVGPSAFLGISLYHKHRMNKAK